MLVTKDALSISPQGQEITVTVSSGDTLYYNDTDAVSAARNQGSLTAGQSATFTRKMWLRSASFTTVSITEASLNLTTEHNQPQGLVVTPEDFGAVGNGVVTLGVAGAGGSMAGTDDTNAIKNALAALSPTGGTLLLGPKTYYVNGAPDNSGFGNAVLPYPTMGLSKAQINAIGVNIPFDIPVIRVVGVPGRSKIICPRTDAYSAQNGPMSIMGGPTTEGLGLTNHPPGLPLRVETEGVTFIGPDQPVGGVLDKSCVTSSRTVNCSIFTTTTTQFEIGGASVANLPGVASFGIRAPISGSMESRSIIQECTVNGYGTFVVAANHCVITDVVTNFGRSMLGIDNTAVSNAPLTLLYFWATGTNYWITGWDAATGVRSLTTANDSSPRQVQGFMGQDPWVAPFAPTATFLDANSLLGGDINTYGWSSIFSYGGGPPQLGGRGVNMRSKPIDQAATHGTATLVAGSATVTTGAAANAKASFGSQVTAGIFTPGGTTGAISAWVSADGTVQIRSTSASDTSVVWYSVGNPN